MKEYSQKDTYIEEIRKLAYQEEIVEYIRANIPYEVLTDTEFAEKVIKANPRAKGALDLARIYVIQDMMPEIKEDDSPEKMAEIIDEIGINMAITKYRNEIFRVAKYYEENGNYEKAQFYYSAIVKKGRNRAEKFMKKHEYDEQDTVYYKSMIGDLVCKSAMGQELTEEEKNLLDSTIKTLTTGKKSIDAFLEYFSKVSKEQLLNGDFEKIATLGIKTGKRRKTGTNPKPPHYRPELAPEKRLQHILENYNVTNTYIGVSEFAGYIVFEIEDKNVFVVEKFYDVLREGDTEPQPSTGTATYVLSRNVDLNIEELNKGQLVSMKKGKEAGVASRNHGENYYKNLDASIESIGKIAINGQANGLGEKGEDLKITEEPMETHEEERVNEESQKERTVEDILQEIMQTDAEYYSLIESWRDSSDNLKVIQEQIEQLNEIVTQIEEAIAKTQPGDLADVMRKTIIMQCNNLESLKSTLKELEKLEKEIKSIKQNQKNQMDKNRTKREQLEEEYRGMVGE